MPVPGKLLDLENKWANKTKGKGRIWAEGVRGREGAYAEGLSVATGIPVDEIRRGPMFKNYSEFAANPDQYINKYEEGVEKAARINKWARNFYRALTGRAD